MKYVPPAPDDKEPGSRVRIAARASLEARQGRLAHCPYDNLRLKPTKESLDL